TVRLDAQGAVICHTGVTEQGQGAEAVIAQVVATAFGVPIERVRVITGDTDNTPYGGGTWASRAAGIGGEAAWQAGKALRGNVLALASSILQAEPDHLDIRNGVVVDADAGRERIGLDEVARIAYFRPDTLPPGFQAELMATQMPDIEVGHVVTPTTDSELGAKGAGEAGTAGAPGAVMNAVNDALRPLGATPITEMPITPAVVLRALGRI